MVKKVFILASLFILAACGNDAPTSQTKNSDNTQLIPLAVLQTHEVNGDPGCLLGLDAHFLAKADGTIAKAGLENTVTGLCELYVAGDHREYDLKWIGDECGSKIYEGLSPSGRRLRVYDHSQRLCEDLHPHVIEIKETGYGSGERTFTGSWSH